MRALVKFLSPFKKYIVQLVIITLISAAIALVPPRIMGLIFDNVILSANENSVAWTFLLYMIGLFLACEVIGLVFDYFKSLVLVSVSEKFINNIRLEIFSKLCDLSIRFHNSYKKGALFNRLISDTRQFEDIFRGMISSWIVGPFCFVAILIVLSFINLPLTVLALLPAPIIYVCMWRFVKLLKGRYEKARELEEQVSSFAFEQVSGIATVHTLLVQDKTVNKFENLLYKNLKHKEEIANITARYYPILGFLSSTAVVIVLLYGGFLSIQHEITAGHVVTFIAYLAYIYTPIMNITRANHVLQSMKALLNGIEEILNSKEIVSSGNVEQFPSSQTIKIDNLVFGYDKTKPVLNGASLEIKQGVKVGIVGETGEGKTTLAMLIARLFDPDKGQILLNEINIKDYRLKTFRKNVRMVMQDDTLFDGTILENLSLGADNSSEQEIESICDKLAITKFVSKLSDGYRTIIGEKGYRLSHGERQRLAIARAVLSQPCILILDEATSGLDLATEREVMTGLYELMESRIILIISHRESMIENVDEVYKLENGRLILKKSSHYLQSN